MALPQATDPIVDCLSVLDKPSPSISAALHTLPSVHAMRRLYSVRVSSPPALPAAAPSPLSPASSTVAWCPNEDLVAVITTSGAVVIFHVDSPTQQTRLISSSAVPARYLAWRNSTTKPPMLVVADLTSRVTLWYASTHRLNVWHVAHLLQLPAAPIAIGWNSTATTLAAVLSTGDVAAYYVSERPYRNAYDKYRNRSPQHPVVTSIPNSRPSNQPLFGGPLQCASISPGCVDPTSIVICIVTQADTLCLSVWQLFISASTPRSYESRPLSHARLNPFIHGNCVASLSFPPNGMLFAVTDRSVVVRWKFRHGDGDVKRGWHLQPCISVDNSNAPSALSQPTSSPISLQSFDISEDCRSLLTSSSKSGLTLWDTQTLKVVAQYRVEQPCDPQLSGCINHFTATCFAPTDDPAALVALNAAGVVEVLSRFSYLSQRKQSRVKVATYVARQMLNVVRPAQLRPVWDLLATIAFEGPEVANNIVKELSKDSLWRLADPSLSPERITETEGLLRSVLSAEESSTFAALRLLELAVDAIKASAPEEVVEKLSLSAKDARSYTSSANIIKVFRQVLSSASKVPAMQLAATPLADWILVLCSVWLQRCVAMLAREKHDHVESILAQPWHRLAALVPTNAGQNGYGGLACSTLLSRLLRPASVAAALLIALDEKSGKPPNAPRHYRFSRDSATGLVAAFWEISLTWESEKTLWHKSNTSQLSDNPDSVGSERGQESSQNCAFVINRHIGIAHVIEQASELRVNRAEKALGLHASSKTAGFVTSCIRMNQVCDSTNVQVESSSDSLDPNSQWCPYDILTGRALDPQFPLRRCVVSGLLAVEASAENDMRPKVKSMVPWINKWSTVSPLGGRWVSVSRQDPFSAEFCKEFHVDGENALLSNTVDSGDPNLSNRTFPLKTRGKRARQVRHEKAPLIDTQMCVTHDGSFQNGGTLPRGTSSVAGVQEIDQQLNITNSMESELSSHGVNQSSAESPRRLSRPRRQNDIMRATPKPQATDNVRKKRKQFVTLDNTASNNGNHTRGHGQIARYSKESNAEMMTRTEQGDAEFSESTISDIGAGIGSYGNAFSSETRMGIQPVGHRELPTPKCSGIELPGEDLRVNEWRGWNNDITLMRRSGDGAVSLNNTCLESLDAPTPSPSLNMSAGGSGDGSSGIMGQDLNTPMVLVGNLEGTAVHAHPGTMDPGSQCGYLDVGGIGIGALGAGNCVGDDISDATRIASFEAWGLPGGRGMTEEQAIFEIGGQWLDDSNQVLSQQILRGIVGSESGPNS